MDLQPLVEMAGFLVGVIVHGVLLRLLLHRPRRRPGEVIFAGLAAAMLVWNAGNVVSAIGRLLTNDKVIWLDRAVSWVSLPALVLVPSFLLHTLGVLRHDDRITGWSWRLVYAPLPILALLYAIDEEAARVLLGTWLVGGTVAGAVLALLLAQRADTRPEALPTTVRFYRFLATMLLATAGAAGLIAFNIKHHGEGSFPVRLVTIAASTVPSCLLAYGVNRYYAVKIVVRRGVPTMATAAIGFALYLLALSIAARSLSEQYRWNLRVIEALGLVALGALVGLALAVERVRRPVAQAVSWAIDPRGTKEAAVLKSLANELVRPGASRPTELCARFAVKIRDALGLEHAALAIASPRGDPVAASPPDWVDYRALLVQLVDAPAAMLAPAEVADPGLSRALAEARVERVRPLRYEGELVGALVIGRRADSTRISPDELAALESVAGPLAAACTSARLVDRQLSLERKLQEESRLASLGRFSATVAHRVKNPLASIKAIAQTMREEMTPEDPRRQDLTIVVEEVDTLSKVVSQLLGFARGTPAGDPNPVDVGALTSEVLVLLQHQASATGVRLIFDPPPAGVLVTAEPSALREAIANLVENAILFSPKDGAVRVRCDPQVGDRLRMRISDEGPGVPPEARARLFEPFFTTRPGGTGLGLAVCRQRLMSWGGQVYLDESAPPPGATFVIELPYAADTGATETPAAAPAAADSGTP